MSSGPPSPPRAGFWRRALAITIDGVIVALPFQIIAAVLFAATSGFIQQTAGVTFTNCAMIEKAPERLVPPPPANSNFVRQCTTSLMGYVTAKWLQVGRVTKEGSNTTIVSQTYMLNRAGEPINGMSIDWIVGLAFIAYLFTLERHGATPGDRLTKIRIVDLATPNAPTVPLRKIVVRYLAMCIGFMPMIAVLLGYGVAYGFDADAIAAGGFFTWFGLAAIPAFCWGIWIVIEIVRKRDPVYDRLAGTAVVRNQARSPA